MKRCPICEKVYEYDSLRFCRFDGARLDDVSWREAPTILFEPDEVGLGHRFTRINTDQKTAD